MSKLLTFLFLSFVLIDFSFSANLKIWMGWTKRESGSDGYCQVNGDRGNAFGKFQFDRRYGLVPFMTSCYNYNPTRYGGFKKFIDMGAGSEELKGNTELAALWKNYCTTYAAEFGKLQDVEAVNSYYFEVKREFMKFYGIDIETRSPALKGTAFSMAIRSGSQCAAEKFKGANMNNDLNMMDVAYKTYGDEDAKRWTKDLQYGDAIIAYENGSYDLVPSSM